MTNHTIFRESPSSSLGYDIRWYIIIRSNTDKHAIYG